MRVRNGRNLGFAAALGALTTLALGSTSFAQVPDVIVYDVAVDDFNTNDITEYGQSGGIAAYSFATQSCNSGTGALDWFDSGGDTRHPVIGQNMFRLKDGRFEHIGQSWLKHGFCAVNEEEGQCGPCQSTNCDTLGVGCADTYWADLNDGRDGQSKRFVNAADGTHVESGINPSGPAAIRGRLQVPVADIDPAQNPGAEYFIEGHYVTADDAAAGNDGNNASWRRVVVNSVNNIVGGGPTNRREAAIYAWRDMDPAVTVRVVTNIEGGGTNRTTYYLAYKVTQTGPNTWNYEYALQNLNSDQSAGSLSLTVDPGAHLTNVGFHDVAYHSGDPYDGTDWAGLKTGGEMRWACTDFNTDSDANAVRWGTLYNYRFDANYGPGNGTATIGLFKPGVSTDIIVTNVPVPLVPGLPKDRLANNPPLPGGTVVVTPSIVVERNGSNRNAGGLSTDSPAVVGGEWRTNIDVAGAARSVLLVGWGGPTEGKHTRMGEWLIRPPFNSDPGAGEHTVRIPNDPALAGITFSAQAAVLTEGGWRLTNALDVTIGTASSTD